MIIESYKYIYIYICMFNTSKSGMSNTYCMGIVEEVAVEVNIIG